MLTAIRNWVIRTMMKSKGQTGVVQSLPKRDIVEINTQITAQKLMQAGIDPEALKNADQVENAIIAIESRPKVQQGIRSTKSADVFDLKGKKIKDTDNIMGGEEINQQTLNEELMKTENPYSDLVKTTEKGPKTLKEREAEVRARLEKGNKESAQRIRMKKMVDDAIDNTSPGFSGDRKVDAELVAEDLASRMGKVYDDMPTKERLKLYEEAFQGLTKKKFDPEDMAQGGRAGFSKGSGLKTLFNFLNENNPLQAYKKYLKSVENRMKAGKELEVAGEVVPIAAGGALVTNQMKKVLKKMNEDQKKRIEQEAQEELRKDMEKKAQGGRAGFKDGLLSMLDIQGEGSKSGKQQIKGAPEGITMDSETYNFIINADIPIGEKINLLTKYSRGKGRTRIEKDDQELFLGEGGERTREIGLGINPDVEKGFSGNIMYNPDSDDVKAGITYKFNKGGRAGFFMGSKYPKGLGLLKSLLNYFGKKSDVIKNPSDVLRISNPKAFNKMLEDAKGKVMPKEGIMATDAIKNYQTQMAKDRVDTVREMLERGKRMKGADDKILAYKNQVKNNFMENLNMSEKEAEQAADRMATLAMDMTKMEKTPKITDEGLLQLENVLKNMETGSKKPRDLNADGGRIGFKDGMSRRTFLKILGGLASLPIVGKIIKPIKLATGVKNVPIIKTDNVPGKPEWFDALVNKVIIEGDDVTKKFATGERQSIHQKTLDDGSVVRVTEDVDDGAVRVEYDSDANVFEDTVQMEYKKPLPDEGDPRPTAEFTTAESGPVGRRYGPDDYEIDIDEVGGTSIRDLDSDVSKLKEYATGKKPTMTEIVQNKKRRDKAKAITEDPEAQSDAVVRRQGEAQDSDYETLGTGDDYASGGIARMLGE